MIFAFDQYNILGTLLVSFMIQALFFAFAFSFKTDKVTDFSYSLSFAFLTVFLMLANKAFAPAQMLAAAFVILWAFRLGSYLLIRILRIGKDARFDDKREHFIRFLAFWILQAIAVWAILLPVTVLLSLPSVDGLSALSLVGAFLWAAGFVIEIISDAQKFAFKKNPTKAKGWIQTGLWKYSRHPNYFGEILLWWGVFIFTLPYLDGALYFTVAGPVFITLLLLFVSGIPLLEKSADKKHGDTPEYLAYKRNTSIFFPLPPHKDKA